MFLYPEDVDKRLNWPLGRAERLARRKRLPHIVLPDGSIRFEWEAIEGLLVREPLGVLTPEQLADVLGESLQRIEAILEARPHITPCGKNGKVPIYDRQALAMLRHEINTLDAKG